MTIDELAGMIKGEFDNIGVEIKGIKGEIKEIKNDMASGFKELRADIKGLHQDHEEMELKISNVAYRFEVEDVKNQLNRLKQRADTLEHK